jgi:hypothetical protein
MKRILRSIIIIVSLLVLTVFLSGKITSSYESSAGFIYAQGYGLEVEFGDEPLFYETNFLPGDTVVKQVIVRNESWQEQEIGLRLHNPVEFLLPEVLRLTVRDKEIGETLLEFKTLLDLCNASEEVLFLLGPKRERKLELEIQFAPWADNLYQGVSTTFDLSIGFIARGPEHPAWPTHGPCPSWSEPGRCAPWPLPSPHPCPSWPFCF